MNREKRAAIAAETIRIVNQRHYSLPDSRKVEIGAAVERCNAATRLFEPAGLLQMCNELLRNQPEVGATRIKVRNETTLAGIRRICAELGSKPVAVLIFASAKNPGGGFLSGSQAQEESLARSSALYASLQQVPAYYEAHRRASDLFYSDSIILSPNCPIFRDDEGQLLDVPDLVNFITCAAPNAGEIATRQRHDLDRLPETLARRSELILAVAAAHGCRSIILGAWGCGVFGNNPRLVANTFANHLLPNRPWHGRFEQVLFSVLDNSPNREIFEAFKETLAIDDAE